MTNQVDPISKKTPHEKHGKRESRQRFSLSLSCGLTMFACAAGYGGYFAWLNPNHISSPAGVLLGVPAVGAVAFVLAAEVFPNVLAPRRLCFPLTVTLPFVFNAFIFLISILLTNTGNSLIAPYEQLSEARFWQMPGVLCLLTFSQIVCLSALAALKSGPVD
jgi:hypothetical protein